MNKENLGVCLAVQPACLRMGIGQLGIRVTNGKLHKIVYYLVCLFFFFSIHLVFLFFFFIYLGVVICVEKGRREVPRGHWSPCLAQIVTDFFLEISNLSENFLMCSFGHVLNTHALCR